MAMKKTAKRTTKKTAQKPAKKKVIRDITAKHPEKVKGGMMMTRALRYKVSATDPCATSCTHETHVLADDHEVC
jgi:hypothetical protein